MNGQAQAVAPGQTTLTYLATAAAPTLTVRVEASRACGGTPVGATSTVTTYFPYCPGQPYYRTTQGTK